MIGDEARVWFWAFVLIGGLWSLVFYSIAPDIAFAAVDGQVPQAWQLKRRIELITILLLLAVISWGLHGAGPNAACYPWLCWRAVLGSSGYLLSRDHSRASNCQKRGVSSGARPAPGTLARRSKWCCRVEREGARAAA
jgi:hypothetical protein